MRRSKTGFGDWASMAMQSTMLAWEAQQVIALRLARLALGDAAARRESQRMVTEKIHAMSDSSQMMLRAALSGQPEQGAKKVIGRYRRTVRANRRRLSK